MRRTKLLLPMVVLAACGGSNKPAPAAPSNEAEADVAVTMDQDVVEGNANPNDDELARQQAIEQARAAGVLGNPAPAPAPAGDPRDKPAIRAVVQGEIKRITYCYEKQLLVKPGIQGTTTATFVIAADGSVSSSTAAGFDAEVDKCVASVLQAARFAPATTPGDVTVNYPFVFKPGP